MPQASNDRHPHGALPAVTAGTPLAEATGVIIALHGRGADAADIVALAEEIAPSGLAILAPQAADHTWYPYRFLEPTERNEPFLSSALRRVIELISESESMDIPAKRVALLGFSQGACLALESAARQPLRYAGVLAFSGGLIGPPGMEFAYDGSLAGTPVFIGSSDVDPHIPKERVAESAVVMERLGAEVDARLYPGMGHTVNRDELEAGRALLVQAFNS